MSNPLHGSTELPPGAAHRSEVTQRGPQHRPGGLLAVGTRVVVLVPLGDGARQAHRGEIIDAGNVPAPYIALADENAPGDGARDTVIFTGPGVIITAAEGPRHPAL